MRRQGFVKRTLALVLTAALIIPQSLSWGIKPSVAKASNVEDVGEKTEYAMAPDYMYNFQSGSINSSIADSATIVGSGKIVTDAQRGFVFDNNSSGSSSLRTDYLSMPKVLEGAKEGFTVSMYIKSSSGAEPYWSSVFSAYNDNQNYPLTQLGFNLIGRVNADGYVDTTDGSDNNVQSYNLMTDGNWHQVAYTVKADEIRVYCDGVEVSKVILDGTAGKSSGVLLNSLSQLTSVNIGGNLILGDKEVHAIFDAIVKVSYKHLPAPETKGKSGFRFLL